MKIDLAISGETKLTGLVGGSGITSSFSPRMHTASFAEVGVDAVYLSFPIAPEMLGEVVQGLQDIAVGYNVTMPTRLISVNISMVFLRLQGLWVP